jgi:hypothetical protein
MHHHRSVMRDDKKKFRLAVIKPFLDAFAKLRKATMPFHLEQLIQ